jgi:hypothetical protein
VATYGTLLLEFVAPLLLLGYVVVWNVAGMGPSTQLPDSIWWVGGPRFDSGLVGASMPNRAIELDRTHGLDGVDDRERSIGPYFGYRWRKYHDRVRTVDGLRGMYARRICDAWTRHYHDTPRLERVVLTHVYRQTSPVTHTSGDVQHEILHEECCG